MFLYHVKYLTLIATLLLIIAPAQADSISIPNHSFETPAIDPNVFPVIPFIASWTEDDVDPCSLNTGTFINSPPEIDNHLINADGSQVAFLGSQFGNALWQYLPATYQQGKTYKLTVGVCISAGFPPPDGSTLKLVFHSLSDPNIISVKVPRPLPSSRTLDDYSVTMPTVQPSDPWADASIGIAIRAIGSAGGFWDLDNVRLTEYPLTPEFTGDSFIGLADFTKMAAEWQSCSEPQTDVTGDGCVNIEDIIVLIQY